MRKLMIMAAALILLAPSSWSQGSTGPCCSDHSHSHVLIVAQGNCYIARCSKGDFQQRCRTIAEAQAAAEAHRKATGHCVQVFKE